MRYFMKTTRKLSENVKGMCNFLPLKLNGYQMIVFVAPFEIYSSLLFHKKPKEITCQLSKINKSSSK